LFLNKKINVYESTVSCITVIVFLFASLLFSCNERKNIPAETENTIDSTEINFHLGICIDSLNVIEYPIESGHNLSSIFDRLGFSSQETDNICKCIPADILDPRKLRAGMHYTVFTDRDSLQDIKYVIFAKSPTDYAVVDLTSDSVCAYAFSKEVTLKRKYSDGVITSSLWNAFIANGDDPLLALKLSDIYAWQIDFFDIKVGDSYKVIYDIAYIDDTVALEITSIEGAVFSHLGEEYAAIPFTQDSIMEFFDQDGNSLRRAFLKAPLDFFRISSNFTNSRYHPVLKYYRPHHGVDYAAPAGTPVKTIGDGTVITKSYQSGGAGNYLKIKHNSTYTTSYMHLKDFAKGIKVGSKVKQGDVVGYVGSTGLSTGPHLDFRVYKNDKPIDPLKMESPPSLPVKPELKDSFLIVKQAILSEMNSLGNILNRQRAEDIVNKLTFF